MLKGTLDDFTLSDIFRLTALAKKTGRLEVERRNGSGRVYFREGEVYHAESTKSKELLGSKLTRSGRVTEKQLRRAVIDQEQTGRRLGELLIEQGAVEEEADRVGGPQPDRGRRVRLVALGPRRVRVGARRRDRCRGAPDGLR